jgi:serine/threonine protein kinase
MPVDIVHGDVKCENVLIFNSTSFHLEHQGAKLADFGNATSDLLEPDFFPLQKSATDQNVLRKRNSKALICGAGECCFGVF